MCMSWKRFLLKLLLDLKSFETCVVLMVIQQMLPYSQSPFNQLEPLYLWALFFLPRALIFTFT